MGGDLTLDQIRTLSTTSQRSAISVASVASFGSHGPAAHDREQTDGEGASSAAAHSSNLEATESVGRRKVPGIPSVSPRPRTTAATPNGKAKEPSSPQKKKSSLPRVATLAQSSTPRRTQSKPESPPRNRAGGGATSTASRRVPGAASGARRASTTQSQTPNRGPSSVMARDMSTKSSTRTTAGTAGAAAAKASTPTSTQQRPQWGVNTATNNRRNVATSSAGTTNSRRAIAKPPENIKRAIKESQLLTDSLDSKEDSEMQNLKEILNDIKTIKTELGVESATGKTDESIEGAVCGDAGPDGEAESANTMPSPRGAAKDATAGTSPEKSPRKSVEKSPRNGVEKSPRNGVAVAKSPTKETQETSMGDSADILGDLDRMQGEDTTFLVDSKKLTDELDEVSGPSYAEVEMAAVKEEIKAEKAEKGRGAGSKTLCCSVM